MENSVKINAQIGETFKIGKYEFIRFKETQGGVAVVCKDCLYRSRFGEDNNLATSNILKLLVKEILPEIEDAVGSENILHFETDLLSLDGSEKHGKLTSKISLPTFDFYRHNVKILDRYKPDDWWWLATPESTTEHSNDGWILCVSPSGYIDYDNYRDVIGVRPFLILSSFIFKSCEE